MNEEQQRIWDYLTNHAVGRNNTIHVSDLATHLGYMPNGTNNDNVRKLITKMVMNNNLPIGTCKDGVFLFTNDIEREEAARFVERRTKSSVIRTLNFYTRP
ncbi:MAG: hypothetical protein WCL70_10935 [Paludibacter sp.]